MGDGTDPLGGGGDLPPPPTELSEDHECVVGEETAAAGSVLERVLASLAYRGGVEAVAPGDLERRPRRPDDEPPPPNPPTGQA